MEEEKKISGWSSFAAVTRIRQGCETTPFLWHHRFQKIQFLTFTRRQTGWHFQTFPLWTPFFKNVRFWSFKTLDSCKWQKKQNNKEFYSLRGSPSSCKTIPKTCRLHSSCILKFQAQPGLILLPRAGWRDGDEMDSITGWLMTLTTAAGSTASERTQKKHLEIPHAKEQVGGNRQQSPRLGRVFFFFCRLEDELAEEKVWLAPHLWGTNLSCRFCSAREDLERSLTSDVSDVGKEPAANGDCSALLRPGAPHHRRPHTSLWQQDGRKTVHYFILTRLAHDGINRNTARLSAVSVAALKCQGRECPPGSAEAFRRSASVQQVQLHHGQSSYTPTCFESSVI